MLERIIGLAHSNRSSFQSLYRFLELRFLSSLGLYLDECRNEMELLRCDSYRLRSFLQQYLL
jgi:hypothetical protein